MSAPLEHHLTTLWREFHAASGGVQSELTIKIHGSRRGVSKVTFRGYAANLDVGNWTSETQTVETLLAEAQDLISEEARIAGLYQEAQGYLAKRKAILESIKCSEDEARRLKETAEQIIARLPNRKEAEL